MSLSSVVEGLQSKLVALIVPLGKDELYELCVHFDIPEADFDSKTRLGLIAALISKSEQLVSYLKAEEREPLLLDCLRIVSKMGEANGEEQKQIKELEANIASQKEQQMRELEAAKERLKAARSETGASPNGSNIANLKSILRRDFRIAGVLGPQEQKDSLSLMSLNKQMEEGLKKVYGEKEVTDGIIRCIPSHLPLKDSIEAMRESELETINKILRAHFQKKNASELYTSLTGLVQSTREEQQNFPLRAMNLREKVIFASKVGNAKVRYEPVQCQSTFLHAVETGLIRNILRMRMRPHLQNAGVSDAELINELNIAVTEELERNLKLGLGMRGKAKVAQVQSTRDIKNDEKKGEEAFSVKELLAEVRALYKLVVCMAHLVKVRSLPSSLDEIRKFANTCEICAECKPQYYHPESTHLIKAKQPF